MPGQSGAIVAGSAVSINTGSRVFLLNETVGAGNVHLCDFVLLSKVGPIFSITFFSLAIYIV